MLIALMSDIHANREAFSACLDAMRASGAQRLVLLGDIVGYGADPEWCLDMTRSLLERGAIAIRGNHDDAISRPELHHMNGNARQALDWTRYRLDPAALDVLAGLPLQVSEDDRLYVHASGDVPDAWHYMLDIEDARGHFMHCDAAVTFCGHTHRPALFSATPLGRVASLPAAAEQSVLLEADRQWLAVLGSVGQPRDGNAKAAWATYDTGTRELVRHRTPYDIATAAAKIRAAGLPTALADRLENGF